jgi:hypothetical protein
MGGQVAIGCVQFTEASLNQGEMACFIGRDRDPVGPVFLGQGGIREAGNQVPGEIDGFQFDMSERVEERDAVRRTDPLAPPGYAPGREQNGAASGRAG